MGKVVLDLTVSLDEFTAGTNDEMDALNHWIFSGGTGDIPHLTENDAKLPDEEVNTSATSQGRAGGRTFGVSIGLDGDPSIHSPASIRHFPVSLKYDPNFNSLYFYYRSKHIGLEIFRAAQFPALIHFRFRLRSSTDIQVLKP